MHVNSILNSKLVSYLSYIKILGFCLKDLAFELTHSLVSEAMPFFVVVVLSAQSTQLDASFH